MNVIFNIQFMYGHNIYHTSISLYYDMRFMLLQKLHSMVSIINVQIYIIFLVRYGLYYMVFYFICLLILMLIMILLNASFKMCLL